MTTITASVNDITGVDDNSPWSFHSVLREGSDGGIISPRTVHVTPVDGVLTVELDPGFAIVQYGRSSWNVIVPDEDANLWVLIEASVASPPDTSAAVLAAAIANYTAPVVIVADEAAYDALPVKDPGTIYVWPL